MNDETALVLYVPMEQAASIAEAARAKNALDRYREKLSDETLERQRYDLELLNKYLADIPTQPGDFYGKPSAKAPVFQPGDEAPFLLWERDGVGLFENEQEAVVVQRF